MVFDKCEVLEYFVSYIFWYFGPRLRSTREFEQCTTLGSAYIVYCDPTHWNLFVSCNLFSIATVCDQNFNCKYVINIFQLQNLFIWAVSSHLCRIFRILMFVGLNTVSTHTSVKTRWKTIQKYLKLNKVCNWNFDRVLARACNSTERIERQE